MAITYKWSDAWNMANATIPRRIEDDNAAFICNLAQNEVWNAYDWRVSLNALPPFYCQPLEQDYGTPIVAVPADFQGLRQAYFVQLASTPPWRQPLNIIRDLQLTHIQGFPASIDYIPSTQSFRVFPRLPVSLAPSAYCIDGTYKKLPTKITAANMPATLLPFDDLYFQVWLEAIKYYAYSIMNDPRAGTAQVQGNKKVYTGQLANMVDKIMWAAQNEGLELGDPAISPSQALALSGVGGYGFGYLWPSF